MFSPLMGSTVSLFAVTLSVVAIRVVVEFWEGARVGDGVDVGVGGLVGDGVCRGGVWELNAYTLPVPLPGP